MKNKKRKTLNVNNSAFTQRFQPDLNTGLSLEEVEYHEHSGNINISENSTEKTYLQIILNNVFTFFNILMLSIAVIMVAVCGLNIILNLSFLIILFSNIIIGTVQECKSKKALNNLKLLNLAKTKVLRNGEETEILGTEIVLDDVIILSNGEEVPVDGIVYSDSEIEVNESLLTGESKPIKKYKGDPIYAGSFIVSGTFKMKAEKVGNNTYVSTLEGKVKNFKKPTSKLTKSINKIIKMLAAISIPLAIIVFWNNLLSNNLQDAVLFAGTTITYMIPAGLMLLTSIALMSGVIKLSKKNTLTQDLYSVESLSRIDTLCLDKTRNTY